MPNYVMPAGENKKANYFVLVAFQSRIVIMKVTITEDNIGLIMNTISEKSTNAIENNIATHEAHSSSSIFALLINPPAENNLLTTVNEKEQDEASSSKGRTAEPQTNPESITYLESLLSDIMRLMQTTHIDPAQPSSQAAVDLSGEKGHEMNSSPFSTIQKKALQSELADPVARAYSTQLSEKLINIQKENKLDDVLSEQMSVFTLLEKVDIDDDKFQLSDIKSDLQENVSSKNESIKNKNLGLPENITAHPVEMKEIHQSLCEWGNEVNQMSSNKNEQNNLEMIHSQNGLDHLKSFSSITQGNQTENLKNDSLPIRILSIETKYIPEPGQDRMGMNHAIIHINPAELGPISAKINIIKNKAIMEISVKDSRVAEMMKSHLPLLKEQFSQSSLKIESIHIQNEQTSNSAYEENSTRHHHKNELPEDESVNILLKSNTKKLNNNDQLIDAYI